MRWLDVFRHLLPNARAWRLTVEKTLRRFFVGLEGSAEDAREFIDLVYLDLFPDTTRALDEWERQFGLQSSAITDEERRARLSAAWRALGGQSPRYIQDTLQAAGFDVYVHEWWEPIPGRPGGGSVDNDVTPVARVPSLYLSDGTGGTPWEFFDGGSDAQDGDSTAQDGGTNTPAGYPLVNKINEAQEVTVSDGSPLMSDGGPVAQDGGTTVVYPLKQYVIPSDPATFPYFLYIGGETFPEVANVPAGRRDEFERLCLKICPTEQWLGILVEYS